MKYLGCKGFWVGIIFFIVYYWVEIRVIVDLVNSRYIYYEVDLGREIMECEEFV